MYIVTPTPLLMFNPNLTKKNSILLQKRKTWLIAKVPSFDFIKEAVNTDSNADQTLDTFIFWNHKDWLINNIDAGK